MQYSKNFGIDIGTTFLTIYSLDSGKVFLRERHEGKIIEHLKTFSSRVDESATISITGKGGRSIAAKMGCDYIEESVAVAKAVEKESLLDDDFGKIIDIGGSSLTLYTIKNGKITDIAKNALCAAGTGLFLEEQAERLNLDLEKMGELQVDNPPLIASRCTVFAKSDLIHHQQEGRSKKEMWAGLCKSLSISAMNTLFRGEDLYGKVVLIGGVSLNREVLRWLKSYYPDVEWIIPKHGEAIVAMGAAYITGRRKDELTFDIEDNLDDVKKMPELTLKKSKYPEFTIPNMDIDANEIRINRPLEKVKSITVGMDIGSTSTKIAALDCENSEQVFDIYRKTGGDPINAARLVFKALFEILGGTGITIEAFGTTGSGRKLVGEIFGADSIVNEITAHGTGTGT